MKYRTIKGDLTLYALSLGYIESFEKNNIKITLEKDSLFHIKIYYLNEKINWVSTEKLIIARFIYRHIVHRLKIIPAFFETSEDSIKTLNEFKEYVKDYP